MGYRANVTDKQQADLERFYDHSAIRFPCMCDIQATAEMRSIRAYDLQAQGSPFVGGEPAINGEVTSAIRQFSKSGMTIGCHNDHPGRFENPGKA